MLLASARQKRHSAPPVPVTSTTNRIVTDRVDRVNHGPGVGVFLGPAQRGRTTTHMAHAELERPDSLSERWLRAQHGREYGEASTQLLQDVLGDDAICTELCLSGRDNLGRPLLEESTMLLLTRSFGDSVAAVRDAIHRLVKREWFVWSQQAFEQLCATGESQAAAGYGTGASRVLFGACMGEHSLVLLKQSPTAVESHTVEYRELEALVADLLREGCVEAEEIQWSVQFASQRLCVEAASFGRGEDVPLCSPATALSTADDRGGVPLVWAASQDREELTSQNRVSRSGVVDQGVVDQGEPALSSQLSGYSYRFIREVSTAFEDAARTDWTALLQWTLNLPTSSPFNREQKRAIFASLRQAFVETARPFAEELIADSLLPEELRTIEPDAKFGGVAGGKKYRQNPEGTILFKFAEDVKIKDGSWLYGGQEPNHRLAMKSAGHELKSAQALIDAQVIELGFPLMATFTLNGKRVLCASLLPVDGDKTLVQGKANLADKLLKPPAEVTASRRHTHSTSLHHTSHIHTRTHTHTHTHAHPHTHTQSHTHTLPYTPCFLNGDRKVEDVMRGMARSLGLGQCRQTGVFGPFDLEVHRGSDGGHLLCLGVFSIGACGAPVGQSSFTARWNMGDCCSKMLNRD
jgi:hypothetical protein